MTEDQRKPPRGYSHRLNHCSGCGEPINTTWDPKDRGMPHPKDITMCILCGTLMVFDHGLKLKPLTPEDVERLPPKTVGELKEMQDRWRHSHGKAPLIVLPERSKLS